jgi:hypothetical protein
VDGSPRWPTSRVAHNLAQSRRKRNAVGSLKRVESR